jgi:hypothetical protein
MGDYVAMPGPPDGVTAAGGPLMLASLFGDMALAAAIAQIEAEGFATLTNYGAFLVEHPPAFEVQIRERTSWSCPHGIERWQSDCGCKTRGDWHQRWRTPLREVLDWLRDQIDIFYESRASAFLKDPWEARDAYIEVVLDRSREGLATWLAGHQRILLDAGGQVETRRLLEMERNRLLMYTSCGWFFDEISALEPVQILKYAAMALQYLRELGGGHLEGEFVRRLEDRLVAELRRAAGSTPLPEPLFDALTERPTPERVAGFEALVLGLKRLGLHVELWQTQNRFFALWRERPEARETLRPLADVLEFALAAEATR